MKWRPRFTIRLMMIFVAVVALGIAAEIMRERLAYFRERARTYANFESNWRVWADSWSQRAAEAKQYVKGFELPDDMEVTTQNAARLSERAQECQRRAAYFSELRSKYEQAARRPWLSVESDPPSPFSPESEALVP